MSGHYDVIIIGGRPAGASLAIRLARQRLNVLVVDRAEFPSLPAVPSSPIIHAGTMRLMDELNIPEVAYTRRGGRIDNYVIDIPGLVTATLPTRLMNIDRNYLYGIDRHRFDYALWSAMRQYPNITARQCFSVMSITNNTVTGKQHGQPEESFSADLIVGADGRFSLTAREVGANVVEDHNNYPTSSYHAEWDQVAGKAHTLTVYNTLQGMIVLCIPTNTGRYIIATYKRYGSLGQVENAYLEALRSIPRLWRRLSNANKVSEVVGVRKIQNGYREAYGEGWALTGDALHYKDPLDGQGIYDALLESKLLAESITRWKNGELNWNQAGELYRQRVMDETYPMFIETVNRVYQQMYSPPPATLKERLLTRWRLTDPAFQAEFLRYLSRAQSPDERGMSNKRILVRGLIRELSGRVVIG